MKEDKGLKATMIIRGIIITACAIGVICIVVAGVAQGMMGFGIFLFIGLPLLFYGIIHFPAAFMKNTLQDFESSNLWDE